MQNLDLSTPTGRAMLWIIIVFAQWEREMLGERVKSKMVSIASSGGWPSGHVPFGYVRSGKKNDNFVVQEPRQSEIVLDLFRRYQAGESVDMIASSYAGQPRLSKTTSF
jgi:DNA invertase Pin-like site-specific DNA recombinase